MSFKNSLQQHVAACSANNIPALIQTAGAIRTFSKLIWYLARNGHITEIRTTLRILADTRDRLRFFPFSRSRILLWLWFFKAETHGDFSELQKKLRRGTLLSRLVSKKLRRVRRQKA